MRYSISQVAKFAGVTSRTLRHYDSIGLLSPSEVSASGYRWYGQAELRRLQRILLMRQMGVGLTEIEQVLNGQTNEVAALRFQRRQVLSERNRLDAIVDTIERTVAELTGNHEMDPEDFFRGLHQDRSHLRKHLTARHGPDAEGAFITTESVTAGWDITDYEQEATKSRELLHRMAALVHQGIKPADDNAQRLIDEHHKAIAQFWIPDAATYSALADLYLRDDQQRSWITDVDPALPPWLAAAMKAYATRLSTSAADS